MILEILRIIKVHIQSNLKIPHPTLVAICISAAITVVVLGIFYLTSTGIMGIGDAEAAPKWKPDDRCC
ncbi:MAG TPA: hypothetical protein VFM31_08305 [Nitrososphaeraceae archaeon]|nr:hypothetical protein [Nitrososphaeraceae archaeon]